MSKSITQYPDGYTLYVRKDGKSVSLSRVPMASGAGETGAAYDEAWLQALIHANPACLPFFEIDGDLANVVAICRELRTPAGYVDNFLLTPKGHIALVEAKLWRNIEARRKVLVQALDYAASLFRMSYVELEKQILEARRSEGRPAESLYALIKDQPDALDEARFIDAVSENLRRGYGTILIVGDGIRADLADLTDYFSRHSNFPFDLALVEMVVFSGLEPGDTIVQPRIVARTHLVPRYIVEIDDKRAEIREPAIALATSGEVARVAPKAKREAISEEAFFAAIAERDPRLPAALRRLSEKLAPMNVYTEFQQSFILKWDPPSGKPVNFGYIKKAGQIWTDVIGSSAPIELAREYIVNVARIFDGEVEKEKFAAWHVRVNGDAPRAEQVIDRFDAWADEIVSFIRKLSAHYAKL